MSRLLILLVLLVALGAAGTLPPHQFWRSALMLLVAGKS